MKSKRLINVEKVHAFHKSVAACLIHFDEDARAGLKVIAKNGKKIPLHLLFASYDADTLETEDLWAMKY